MATNAQVTPLGLSLNRFARAKAIDQIWKRGLSLPCSVVAIKGNVVQVAFQFQQPPGEITPTLPNVVIPVATSEYVRLPIQVGCKGVAMAADAYLGGMSGLGGGVANINQTGNLTALVFHPISNTGWFSVNGNILTVYGPGGVTAMDQGQTTFIKLVPNRIDLIAGGHTLTVDSSGLLFDGIVFGTHIHEQPADSHGDTMPPTTGPINP